MNFKKFYNQENILSEGFAIVPHNSIDTKIYVDMDGVLCDLYNVVAEDAGKENYKDLTQEEYSYFFKKNADVMQDIFANLPKYEMTDFLIELVHNVAGEYRICTARLKKHDSSKVIEGKNIWMDKNLKIQPAERIFERDKFKYATTDGRPNILIDDWDKNIKKWEDNGGIGILYCANEDDLCVVIEGLAKAKDILDNGPQRGYIME